MNREPSAGTVVSGLGLAVAAVSSAALLILLAAPLPPLVIAAGRVTVTGLAFGVLVLLSRQQAVPGRGLPWGAATLAASLLAIHFATWVASLSLTSVVRSTTLVATQPLFAALVGRLLGDRASWTMWLGALVAVTGTAVMVGVASPEASFVTGDALAVVAALAAASYLVVGRSVRAALPLRNYLCLVHLMAGAMLVVAALGVGDAGRLTDAGDETWLAIVALGLLPGVVGHGLLNWGVRHVPVHVVSLAILLEPLGATGLAWIVLDEPVGTRELVGAGILLMGVAVALPKKKKPSAVVQT